MTEQAKHDSVTGKGFVISTANIIDGKLENVVFKGDPLNMLAMAHALVNSSMQSMQPVQRPLQRKFDTILEKLTAMQADVETERDTRAEREQAKNHRDVAKMCDLIAKASKNKGY